MEKTFTECIILCSTDHMGVACLKFHGENFHRLRKLASSPWKYAEIECVQHEDVSNEKTTIFSLTDS